MHNRLTPQTESIAPTTPFNTLQVGQRFNNGQLIWKRDENSITVKRADGWLVTVCVWDWAWGKLIRIEK